MSFREIRRHVGQLAILGFPGHTITPELRSIAREFDLGGVILFARNVVEPVQVLELATEARELRQELPLWVSVDQEGGRVARLRDPFTVWPPMGVFARVPMEQAEALARRFARALAAELEAAGINLDFAPVLDIHTNPANPVIGDRALGEQAEHVARLGRAIIETLQQEGLAACGKHFPGHGDTSTDSHHDLPLVEHPPDRIRRVELVPFRAAVEARVASIMTAHVLLPAFDEERPATLSPRIVDALLKRELGYDGLVLSDDLEMKAISGRYSIGDAAVRSIEAGCDAFLVCGTHAATHIEALESIVHAVEQERLPATRVEDALARHRRVKERFLAGTARRLDARQLAETLGRSEHRAVAEEMARFA
jgi:beta-N-acetylhexosaminidase